MRLRPFLLLSAALVTGCGAGFGGCNLDLTNGLAENGSFDYECVSEADLECDKPDDRLTGRIPYRPIARGAHFRLRYLAGPYTAVEPVSLKAAARAGQNLVGLRTGRIGFYVRAANKEIEDAIRFPFEEADRIGIAPIRETSLPAKVAVGQDLRLRVIPLRESKELAGSVPVTWSVEPPELASIGADGVGVANLTALAAGSVRVRATFDDLVAEYQLEVESYEFDAGVDADLPDADGLDAEVDG